MSVYLVCPNKLDDNVLVIENGNEKQVLPMAMICNIEIRCRSDGSFRVLNIWMQNRNRIVINDEDDARIVIDRFIMDYRG